MRKSIYSQGFIQDFRFGGGDSTTRGVWGHVPPGIFFFNLMLRLILGHFLVHMQILANTLHSSKRLCILA